MLSLARRPGQRIRIGEDIIIVVREVRGRQVKLGIEAPDHVRVLREEIYEAVADANVRAAMSPAFNPTLEPDRTLPDCVSCPSARFGSVHGLALELPLGLPGFSGHHWVLAPSPDPNGFGWLQSVHRPEFGLTTATSARLKLDATFEPRSGEHALVCPNGSGLESLEIWHFMWRPAPEAKVLVNRFAPLFVNPEARMAIQIPLVGSGLSVEAPWSDTP